MKLVQQGQAGQAFPFKIWMSNLGSTVPQSMNYALVQFLNYRQVDFNGKNVFGVRLDEKQEVLLDDQIILPDQPGLNEVQVVYVIDPYQSLLKNEVGDAFVHGSECLGIEAK